MISKLKKFVATDGAADPLSMVPDGVKIMGQNLQRKFARGVQYNMKLIIKGERNTGKSTLLYRLQGYKFQDEYTATDEIQVAVIHWSAATSDEIVKVDIWDIVDKGKRKKQLGLKLSNDPNQESQAPEPCLDADFLDVFKGTHAVIFTLDITKEWTYEYVVKQLPLVPHEIPVLVMANFLDLQEKRVVSQPKLQQLRGLANRPLAGAPVVVIESSLKDGFGLKVVHLFLNLPFLSLQRKSLQQSLERNKNNQIEINEMFQNIRDRPECDYDAFLRNLAERRQIAESRNKSIPQSPEKQPTQTERGENGTAAAATSSGLGSKISRMFSKRSKPPAAKPANCENPDNLDSFLDDAEGGAAGTAAAGAKSDLDSDEENAISNPMVANFYDDIESDPFDPASPAHPNNQVNGPATPSSSEEDAPVKAVETSPPKSKPVPKQKSADRKNSSASVEKKAPSPVKKQHSRQSSDSWRSRGSGGSGGKMTRLRSHSSSTTTSEGGDPPDHFDNLSGSESPLEKDNGDLDTFFAKDRPGKADSLGLSVGDSDPTRTEILEALNTQTSLELPGSPSAISTSTAALHGTSVDSLPSVRSALPSVATQSSGGGGGGTSDQFQLQLQAADLDFLEAAVSPVEPPSDSAKKKSKTKTKTTKKKSGHTLLDLDDPVADDLLEADPEASPEKTQKKKKKTKKKSEKSSSTRKKRVQLEESDDDDGGNPEVAKLEDYDSL